VVTAVVGDNQGDSDETLVAIAEWYERIGREADRFVLCKSVDAIGQSKASGKLGIVMRLDSADSIEWELGLVERYYHLGVRMMCLVYSQRNRVANGSGEPNDCGLSVFGRKVVQEMNRLGIVVDATHCGDQSARDAIEVSTRPPVISHANARALCDNGRNASDELIKAVAAKGGLVGVQTFCACVRKETDRNTTLDDLLDHVDYVVNLVGADHVGLGLDYFKDSDVITEEIYEWAMEQGIWYEPDYIRPYLYRKDYAYPAPDGLEDASQLPNLTAGLLKRGYSEDDVLKILGGNWMRVFEANWQ
jgi:membrane dipeptidase